MFDPRGDYLKPSLQGYRLREGRYEPIALVDGRLPSAELGLSFERDGALLQVYDPVVGSWLPTAKQLARRESQRRQEAEQQKQEAEQRQREAEQGKQEAEQRQREAEQREQEAEQRRQEEAQRRKLAEEQQRLEEQRRLVAEEQLNRDRAEIERLRALLNQKDAQR